MKYNIRDKAEVLLHTGKAIIFSVAVVYRPSSSAESVSLIS